MKTIGIVCEGDRDYDMITEVIMCFTNEEFQFLWLQPNSEFGTDLNGAGWKGVWRWCRSNANTLYLNGVTPKIDLLIIQMDADVARCEKEAFCLPVDVQCPGQGKEDPLNCSIAKEGKCSQKLPPNEACDGSVQEQVNYLTTVISDLLNTDEHISAVITIPCDSADAWILAAFEEKFSDIETINSPWEIITHKKEFHGIRIPGGKKSKRPYAMLIKGVCDNWKTVKAKCPQSHKFENNVKKFLGIALE